jgi:hypothetical protein
MDHATVAAAGNQAVLILACLVHLVYLVCFVS